MYRKFHSNARAMFYIFLRRQLFFNLHSAQTSKFQHFEIFGAQNCQFFVFFPSFFKYFIFRKIIFLKIPIKIHVSGVRTSNFSGSLKYPKGGQVPVPLHLTVREGVEISRAWTTRENVGCIAKVQKINWNQSSFHTNSSFFIFLIEFCTVIHTLHFVKTWFLCCK